MISKHLIVLAAAALLTTVCASRAFSDVRREKTERRPYIVEIGEPYSVSMATVQRQAEDISQLRDDLELHGYPDYAEIQEIQPDWPWEPQEVRLFYMRRNVEVDYGHVILSSAAPNFGVLKFEGAIPPDKRHQIEVILQARSAPSAAPVAAPAVAAAPPAAPAVAVAPPPPPVEPKPSASGLSEALVARIEAAAERAAQAADHAAEESEAAVRAADRTVNIVDKMVQSTSAGSQRHR